MTKLANKRQRRLFEGSLKELVRGFAYHFASSHTLVGASFRRKDLYG